MGLLCFCLRGDWALPVQECLKINPWKSGRCPCCARPCFLLAVTVVPLGRFFSLVRCSCHVESGCENAVAGWGCLCSHSWFSSRLQELPRPGKQGWLWGSRTTALPWGCSQSPAEQMLPSASLPAWVTKGWHRWPERRPWAVPRGSGGTQRCVGSAALP